MIEVCGKRVHRAGFPINIYSHFPIFIRGGKERSTTAISDTAFPLFSFLVSRKMGKEATREVESQVEVVCCEGHALGKSWSHGEERGCLQMSVAHAGPFRWKSRFLVASCRGKSNNSRKNPKFLQQCGSYSFSDLC